MEAAETEFTLASPDGLEGEVESGVADVALLAVFVGHSFAR